MTWTDRGGRFSGSSLIWWAILVPTSLVLSAWLYIWVQWWVPREDNAELVYCFVGAFAVGGIVGLGFSHSRSTVGRWALLAVVGVLGPLAAGTYLGDVFAYYGLPLPIALMGMVIGQSAGRDVRGTWRIPLRVSCIPIVSVLTTALPPINSYKVLWPWSTLRPALAEFHQNAVEAGRRLGLPENHELTDDQRERWAREVPLELRLDFPIIGKHVTARMDSLTRWVEVYWGDGEFGPMDPKTMFILYASD